MPTGYTQGILDGTTKDFKSYATKCLRAFGAAIHMRDEDLSAEYRPEQPSEYHEKQILKWTEDLEAAQRRDPRMFYYEHVEDLKKDIIDNRKKIEERKSQRARLDQMLREAQGWTPPTDEHQNFKRFMIQQLEETIKWDGDWEFYEEELLKSEQNLRLAETQDLETYAETLKEERIRRIQEQIKYHREHYEEDVNRCESRNRWASQLIESVSN